MVRKRAVTSLTDENGWRRPNGDEPLRSRLNKATPAKHKLPGR